MTETKQNDYTDYTEKELIDLVLENYAADPGNGILVCRNAKREFIVRKCASLSGLANNTIYFWMGFKHGRNYGKP